MIIPFPSIASSLHNLSGNLDKLAEFPNRRSLEGSEIYRALSEKINAAHHTLCWDNRFNTALKRNFIRLCAWNIERGKQLDGILHTIRNERLLGDVDIFLLIEVDIGMGRTGNVNIAETLAKRLNMNYVFSAAYLELTAGDVYERQAGFRNMHALHGDAILSRFPIDEARQIPILSPFDKYHHTEKRLGDQKTLTAKIRIGNSHLNCAAIHLENYTSTKNRARQLYDSLSAFDRNVPVIAGGDFNTSTYNASSPQTVALSLARKLFFTGFDASIYHYMTPEKLFEKPVFDTLSALGFSTVGFNDRSKGTFYYDVNDPALQKRTRTQVPNWVRRWINRKLASWNGITPLKMDWFVARGLTPIGDPVTIERPRYNDEQVSDHNPIITDIAWPQATLPV